MKSILPLICFLFPAIGLQSQATHIPDTILIQTFTVDPSDTMLIFPTGNDLQWINWDADNLPNHCEGNPGEIIPGNWFWEADFGDPNNPPINSAFTSCSFLTDTTQANENWLITPPVFIPDSATILQWRSSSIQGPGFLDGYKVLVSKTTNEPFAGAFQDTIFMAAEMLTYPEPLTLNPNDYTFSPGYIHANRYTNPDYFFLIKPDAGAYTGRLEPHEISLKWYAGKTIYIAFLHDSTNDLLLQIDDIAIIHGPTIPNTEAPKPDYLLKIQPNPVNQFTTIFWKFPFRQDGYLLVHDLLGRLFLEQPVDLGDGSCQLNTSAFSAGLYSCTLRTTTGQQTILLVKQ